MSKSLAYVFSALLLAASFIGVAKIGSDTVIALRNKGDVSVKGFAKKEIVSDYAQFQVTVSAEGIDLKTCYAELAVAKSKLESYLAQSGLKPANYSTLPASIEEWRKISPRGHALNEVEKYSVHQTYLVGSADVNRMAEISAGMVNLLGEGLRLSVSSVAYIYTGLDDLKLEMIGLATENAKQRAQTIASKGGFRLGSILDVRVGIFQITPRHSTDVSDSGINDTSSIDKEIKSVVEIRYFIR